MLAALTTACGHGAPTPPEAHASATASRLSTAMPASPGGHEEGACVALANGDVLAIGGNGSGTPGAAVDRFDHATHAWTSVQPLAGPNFRLSAARLVDGRVIVLGGSDGTNDLSDASLYDATGQTRTAIAPLPAAAHELTVVALADGRALALGGYQASLSLVYDPSKDAWKALAAVPLPQNYGPYAARLSDGRVLVVAGDNIVGMASALFDPRTETWTAAGALEHGDDGSALTALPGGSALFVGGGSDDAPIATAEIFDASTGTWSGAPSMPHGHASPVVPEPLAGGLIALYSGERSGAVDLFDPARRAWRTSGYALSGRVGTGCVTRVSEHDLLLGPGSIKFVGYTEGTATELFTASLPGVACKLAEDCLSGVCDPATGLCGALSSEVDAGAAANEAGAASVVNGAFMRCTKGSECPSGHCVDGVCCDTACEETCHSCALPSAPGKCMPEPAGVDLRAECGIAGGCTGTCNGAGTCVDSTAGSQCRAARCTSATTGVGPAQCVTSGGQCDEEGVVPFDCAPYACAPAFGACLTRCVTSADCAGGTSCDTASGACTTTASSDSRSCATSEGAPSGSPTLLLGVFVSALVARARRKRSAAR
jgi:hypothetical protein